MTTTPSSEISSISSTEYRLNDHKRHMLMWETVNREIWWWDYDFDIGSNLSSIHYQGYHYNYRYNLINQYDESTDNYEILLIQTSKDNRSQRVTNNFIKQTRLKRQGTLKRRFKKKKTMKKKKLFRKNFTSKHEKKNQIIRWSSIEL